jgi:hypothetical protein
VRAREHAGHAEVYEAEEHERTRQGDLTAQDSDLVPQHQDLHVLGNIAPREQRQPAGQPAYEQIDDPKEHERKG